jgi:NitT/TauT family transport system ATP-binding protein
MMRTVRMARLDGQNQIPHSAGAHLDIASRSTSPAVQISRLRKSFKRGGVAKEVLRDLTLDVSNGEFVAIIGLSGCGKSTLLKILAGLTPFDGGVVQVSGVDVTGPRRDVGFMFQHLALLPWRTVLDNVMLPAEIAKENRSHARDRAMQCLKMVGLDGFANYYLREISGGMQQRVALSRVLMSESKLLLLDEPFSALDELTRENVNKLFMDVCWKTSATAVLVTHSIYEAVFMADRVVVMPAQPGQSLKLIDVPFERPRAPDVMRERQFGEAIFQVREALGLDRYADER